MERGKSQLARIPLRELERVLNWGEEIFDQGKRDVHSCVCGSGPSSLLASPLACSNPSDLV